MRAPVAPTGCPSEMPEPLTFTRSSPSLSSHSRSTASTCAANASFSSIRSMSSIVSPARCSARSVAGTGPMPIVSGGTPATAQRHKAAQRPQAELGGPLGMGDDAHRGAVVLPARVARGHGRRRGPRGPSPAAARRASRGSRRPADARRRRPRARRRTATGTISLGEAARRRGPPPRAGASAARARPARRAGSRTRGAGSRRSRACRRGPGGRARRP